MRSNQMSRYGAIAKALPFTTGKVFFVCNSSDINYQDFVHEFPPDADGQVRVFSTLELAYAAAVSNRGDVIVLNGYGNHKVEAQIAWSKNRIKVIGLDWLLGDHRVTQQSSKITFSLGTEAIAAPIKVTGVRNTFKGIKFIQNSTNAAGLYAHIAAGEGTLYEDCSFIFETNSNTDLTTSSELLCGEDSGTFRNCSFGTDVILSTGARAVLKLDAVTGSASSEGAKSNRFIDCEWVCMTSEANTVMVLVADTDGVKFHNRFVNPSFSAVLCTTTGGVAMTNAVASASGLVNGSIAIEYPRASFITNFAAGVSDQIEITAPVASADAGEGLTPT